MTRTMAGFAAAAVTAIFVAGGCDGKHASPTPHPDAGAPDFSLLDPQRCPAIVAEDLQGFDATAALASSGSWQEDKAFYVFTLIDVSTEATAAVKASPALSAIASQRAQALQTAVSACGGDAGCFGQAARWSATDIASVGDALVALQGSSRVVQALAASLRKSGHAQLHASQGDAELLRSAWLDAAAALNRGWDEHVASLPTATLSSVVADAAAPASSEPFHRPLLQMVLAGLLADGRDECSRYEPLADGENRAVLAHIPEIDFSQYPFATVVVPGQGPGDLDHPLDPGGQVRADQAAARFTAKLAPLIALSGGHVHPDRTPYSEAIEMKKYLMATYAIPENAILVDPHARHTTTNLRNVARQLYRYGVPVDRPSLVTSDWLQTIYIAGASETDVFGKRCIDELGYLPYRGIVQLDELDDCWVPAGASLYADARDLLDP